MEYLMTYGWAILIIAVILGVLFSLGVFNPVNYAPKVPAGNCHVFRPNGPGTNFNVNLVGTCSGFLPQYVAQFNGQNSHINVTSNSELVIGSNAPLTINAWVKMNSNATSQTAILLEPGTEQLLFFYAPTNKMEFQLYISASDVSAPIAKGVWTMITATYDGTNISIYADGESSASLAVASEASTSGPLIIGSGLSSWNGSIANVQIYNTSLDANEVRYLYNEGIGGAPVYLSYLVGWWPLNGDAKDYSGNGNDGIPINLIFNGSWSSGYSQP